MFREPEGEKNISYLKAKNDRECLTKVIKNWGVNNPEGPNTCYSDQEIDNLVKDFGNEDFFEIIKDFKNLPIIYIKCPDNSFLYSS